MYTSLYETLIYNKGQLVFKTENNYGMIIYRLVVHNNGTIVCHPTSGSPITYSMKIDKNATILFERV